jgi:hypothetical protein
MDGRQDGCLDQPGVGQSHEVVVAVDEVKLSRVLERFGDVKIFGYFGIDGGILFIPFVHHGMEASASHRIPAGEQRHVPATGHEAFGDVARYRFPGAVLPGRCSPGYGRKNSHSFVGLGHAFSMSGPEVKLQHGLHLLEPFTTRTKLRTGSGVRAWRRVGTWAFGRSWGGGGSRGRNRRGGGGW